MPSASGAREVVLGMSLAQRFLFSCTELVAIWLGVLQSSASPSPYGRQCFFLCVCYISQNVWPIHLKYLSTASCTGR